MYQRKPNAVVYCKYLNFLVFTRVHCELKHVKCKGQKCLHLPKNKTFKDLLFL